MDDMTLKQAQAAVAAALAKAEQIGVKMNIAVVSQPMLSSFQPYSRWISETSPGRI